MIRFSQRFCSWQSRITLTGGVRWKTTSTSSTANASSPTQDDGTVKPFSAVPSPSGSVPIIKHQRLLKGITSMSEFSVERFKELGPIFKLDFIGNA